MTSSCVANVFAENLAFLKIARVDNLSHKIRQILATLVVPNLQQETENSVYTSCAKSSVAQ